MSEINFLKARNRRNKKENHKTLNSMKWGAGKGSTEKLEEEE